MVFYGYNRDSTGWRYDRMEELASRLSDMVQAYGGTSEHGRPYVEVDGPVGPVVIRKITHLTKEADAALVKDADRIYREVMGLPQVA